MTDYRPRQPTGWPPQQGDLRNGAGVTIGGHVASVPFTIQDAPYEISLLAFGQSGKAPDPVYQPEPSDPAIDFKAALEKAWGAWYSFRYRGGFTGCTALSVQSYSVRVTEPTATHPQLTYGSDLFMVYEPDPSSSDPPITADIRWIEVSNSGGASSTEFRQRANPYYFPGGLTSVYGKQACSFYGAPARGIAVKGARSAWARSAASAAHHQTAAGPGPPRCMPAQRRSPPAGRRPAPGEPTPGNDAIGQFHVKCGQKSVQAGDHGWAPEVRTCVNTPNPGHSSP